MTFFCHVAYIVARCQAVCHICGACRSCLSNAVDGAERLLGHGAK